MIMIDNLNVDDNAPIGTTIGMLTATDAAGGVIACDFSLTKGSRGYFAISSNSLITAWVGSITPGYCSVRIRANGTSTRFSASATFTVTVGAANSTMPTPTGITFTPTAVSLHDDAAAGANVAGVSVAMSDSSASSVPLPRAPPGP